MLRFCFSRYNVVYIHIWPTSWSGCPFGCVAAFQVSVLAHFTALVKLGYRTDVLIDVRKSLVPIVDKAAKLLLCDRCPQFCGSLLQGIVQKSL